MTNFIFADRNKVPCLIFDLCVINQVYSHWDLNQSLEILFDLVDKEIKDLTIKQQQYHLYQDEETKTFLIQQTSNVLLHLKRFKKFLDEGISKDYHCYIER
jgi:hypothetical protein